MSSFVASSASTHMCTSKPMLLISRAFFSRFSGTRFSHCTLSSLVLSLLTYSMAIGELLYCVEHSL